MAPVSARSRSPIMRSLAVATLIAGLSLGSAIVVSATHFSALPQR